MKHVPGWEKTFLTAIKNGYNERTAANMAGVGTGDILHRSGKSPEFKARYDEAHANRRQRPRGGPF
jgi:hypothetical protein